ncbi:methyltransferase domain-containing protein [Parvularcula dongshanensis]|uniref:SAM-dependent methyltransferase n=1 Tax=Parvularcula dongshanensis TaxID=1173995 RepID=A0A840I123_9PROT|nr:SAM-dependent methyltransferase [Parvularcula dongshanensis]
MSAETLLFGGAAEAYARYRPGYPQALFDLLLARTAGRGVALDLGSGTGAMLGPLTDRFERVAAVEPDAKMAALIAPAPNLDVQVASAETAPLPGKVDLVTCGTAFHWFDGPRVLSRLAEVAVPGALLAVCTYYRPDPGPATKAVIEDEIKARWKPFMHDRLGRHDYAARTLDAHGDWTAPERVRVPHRFEMAAEDLAGFHASTSYGSAYLRTLADPQGYLTDFADRLAEANGSRMLTVSLPVETLLSQPAGRRS